MRQNLIFQLSDYSVKWQRVRSAILITLIFASITLVVTYPVVVQLDTSLAQNPEWSYDAFHHTYMLWWFKQALLDLHISPADLQWIHFPTGGYYPVLLTFSTVYLPGIPLQLFLSPVATYNALFLLTFFLSGLSAYALCAHLTHNRWAGLLGGIVYAFFPGRMAHALCGHLELISTYLFPLYLLLFIKVVERPRWTMSLLCGLTLAASLLVQPLYIPFLLALFTLVWLLYEMLVLHRQIERRAFIALGGAFGLAALCTAPFFWPAVCEQMQGQGAHLQDLGVVPFSADLLGIVSPSPINPVLNALKLIPAYAHRTVPTTWRIGELLTYAGVVPLSLAALAAAWRRRRLGVWILVAIAAAVLSLGPALKINDALATFTADDVEITIALPYALLTNLPLLSLNRAPARIHATLMLALAVLSAYGLDWLMKHMPWGRRESAAVALCLITLGEFLVVWPCPTTPVQPPPYLSTLARSANRDPVLNLPITREDASARRAKELALFYQTVHEHPMFDTWVQRSLSTPADASAFLDGLLSPMLEPDIIPPPRVGARAAIARAFDVGHIFLFTRYAADAAPQMQLLSAEFGSPQSTENQIIIHQVPSGPTTVDEPVYVLPGDHWWGVESWNGQPARWISESAEMYIYSPDRQRGSLQFTALPLDDPERMQIEVNGSPLMTLVIGDWIPYTTVSFDLQPGMNRVHFRPLQGCSNVVGDPRCAGVTRAEARDAEFQCLLYGQWERCLSVLFQDIRFVSEQAALHDQSSIVLADQVRFLGHDISGHPEPGQQISLTLYWQAINPPEGDYTVFVHLLGSDGNLVAQHDARPLDGLYPTSEWIVGDVFAHSTILQLPLDLPAGKYNLLAGMYTYPDMTRLPVARDRPHAQDGLIWLQGIEFPP
jgi:hypothetical protein